MKKLSFILVITILTITISSGLVIGAEDSKEGSEKIDLKIKRLKYETNKKNLWGTVGLSLFLPSAGHAYTETWQQGAKFLGIEITELLLINWAYSDNETIYLSDSSNNIYKHELNEDNDWAGHLALIAFLGTKYWECTDSYQTAKEYNQKLRNKIGLEPEISFKNGQTNLALKYNF